MLLWLLLRLLFSLASTSSFFAEVNSTAEDDDDDDDGEDVDDRGLSKSSRSSELCKSDLRPVVGNLLVAFSPLALNWLRSLAEGFELNMLIFL